MLSTDVSWASPEDDKKKKKRWDEDDDDEGSESSSLHPRNISFSSKSERAMKSPAKNFDFQDIPETDIRMHLKEVYDEKSWVGDFLSSWANNEIFLARRR